MCLPNLSLHEECVAHGIEGKCMQNQATTLTSSTTNAPTQAPMIAAMSQVLGHLHSSASDSL